jgi:hypothetical protein
LYGCGTRFITLREEYILKVFENRVLREIFGPRREEVAGGWRRLHNEELRNLYASQNIIRVMKSRRMRWAAHAALMVAMRRQVLIGKPERKIHLGELGVDGGKICKCIL